MLIVSLLLAFFKNLNCFYYEQMLVEWKETAHAHILDLGLLWNMREFGK